MGYPDFFIVGGSRCGTTSLYAYLKQHPDIFILLKIYIKNIKLRKKNFIFYENTFFFFFFFKIFFLKNFLKKILKKKKKNFFF